MSLKIIGGVYGGRVLRAVKGIGTRPLLGQVREAVFNILQDRVPGAVVWDLFAGTGASGIESLSRGAERVLFCEKNGRALDVLRGNLRMLGEDAVARSVVMKCDAWEPPAMTSSVFGARGGGAVGAGGGGDGDGVADGEGGDEDRAVGDGEGGDGARDAVPAAESESATSSAPASASGSASAEREIAPDLVFLDPPYSLVAEDPVKCLARAHRLLDRTARGGCVVFHFEVGALDEDDFDGDLDVDLREWGRTAIAMMWRDGEAPERLQRRWEKERVREGG